MLRLGLRDPSRRRFGSHRPTRPAVLGSRDSAFRLCSHQARPKRRQLDGTARTVETGGSLACPDGRAGTSRIGGRPLSLRRRLPRDVLPCRRALAAQRARLPHEARPRLERLGGSITAGVLAHWLVAARLRRRRLRSRVRAGGRQRRFASSRAKTIDVCAGLQRDPPPGLRSRDFVAGRSYREPLRRDDPPGSLPDRPRFVFNATNLQSGVLWRFSKSYMWDYRVGKIPEPDGSSRSRSRRPRRSRRSSRR